MLIVLVRVKSFIVEKSYKHTTELTNHCQHFDHKKKSHNKLIIKSNHMTLEISRVVIIT
jgi:hypothetical protein